MMRVLWVTNDLPPRAGGIETFVANLLRRTHPATTVVVGPAQDGAEAWDAEQPWRTVRLPGAVLPTPRVRRAVLAAAREHRPEVVVLGAAWPLGELAPALTRALDVPVVALTHGLEAGLADVGLGLLVRRATRSLAAVTTISDYTEQRLRPHLRAPVVTRVPPGVDVSVFRPERDGGAQRARWGVPAAAPLVGCVSRLVARKGQDVLVEVWPGVRRRHPDAWLVLVGSGPDEGRLRRRAADLDGVVVAGGMPWEQLPDAYAALDTFAMPCRTRRAGTDVEGLGIVYLEAQSSGVPAIAGESGGAPEAVRDGETGLVVDGRDRAQVAGAIERLLDDAELRARMGRAGRDWVTRSWSWDAIAARFEALLASVRASPPGDRP